MLIAGDEIRLKSDYVVPYYITRDRGTGITQEKFLVSSLQRGYL